MPKENSFLRSITSLPKKERDRILNSLTQEEAEDVLYDWEFWARPKQLPPPGDWLTWMIVTGRGWGKTRTGSEFVNAKARKGAQHIALIGQTKADVRDTMIEIGPSSILKISNPNFYPKYESSKRRIVWPNGCIGTIYSGDEPGQVRGPSHDVAWIDELSKFKYPKDIWDNLMFGLREGEDMRVLITTTPRPIPIIKNLLKDPNTIAIRGSTFENKENLSQKYFDYVIAPYIGTRLGNQEIEGKILEDNPDALWTRKIIEDNRRNKAPELIRVAVAVDPQATDNVMSSETGIIGGGLGEDRHVYVLEDATIKGSPDQWGRAAVTAYNKLKADRITGEVNNGGDMVEYVIRSIEPNISYNSVRATRGKYLRAEPVSALYEQCVAKGTLIKTITGAKAIENIKVGEMVWTRNGLKRVSWSGITGIKKTLTIKANGNILRCTIDHPIYTINKGFINAVQLAPKSDIILLGGDEICVKYININVLNAEKLLREKELDVDHVQQNYVGEYRENLKEILLSLTENDIINKKMDIGGLGGILEMNYSIGQFGNIIMERYQKEFIYTILMEIRAIMILKIWEYSIQVNMANYIIKNFMISIFQLRKLEKKCLILLKSGGQKGYLKYINVKNVANILRRELQGSGFVHHIATQPIGIESVGKGSIEQVYNLEIEGCPEFFANNILVHNCRIHHVGNFPELEDQQCEWVPGEKSPDRLDALVWLVYELLPDMFEGNNIEGRSAGRRATAGQDW